MIKKQGDVFTTEHQYIAHGCNTKGVMGAGVAARVRSDYPPVYETYKAMCDSGRFNVGQCLPVRSLDKVILNLATQEEPGPNARLAWVAIALEDAAIHVTMDNDYDWVIAMPQIGAGIGGLNWPDVERIVLQTEENYPAVQFEVWEYTP